jgi:hypothetical protein
LRKNHHLIERYTRALVLRYHPLDGEACFLLKKACVYSGKFLVRVVTAVNTD